MTFTSEYTPYVLWLIAIGMAVWLGEGLYHWWRYDHHHHHRRRRHR